MDDLSRELDLFENLCEVGSDRLMGVVTALGGLDRARRMLPGLVAAGLIDVREGSRKLTLEEAARVLWEGPDSGLDRFAVVLTDEGVRVWERRDMTALRRALAGHGRKGEADLR